MYGKKGIVMNFEALKVGFKSYLEEISEISNKTYSTENADISIFMYADEFKNYLSDELNCDSSIFSKSINEILDMEIVNGKLVAPEENSNNLTEENSGDNIIQPGNDNNSTNQTQNTTTEENAQPIASENGVMPGEGSETKIEDPNIITNILNDLLQDKTFKDTVDRDQDGNITEEELSGFLDVIKNYDKNGENISLEDIISAVKDIQDGVFVYATDEEIEEEIGPTPQADAAGISSSGSTGGSSGSSGSFSVPSTYSAAQKKVSGTEEKTLDNMSKEELNSELNSAQADLSDKQNTLSAILDGSDSQIAKLQQNIDDSYDTYLEQLENVDEDLAEQVDNLKTDIDSKEDEIDNKEQEISDQESTVSDSETAYNNAVATRETLESSLDALKSADTSDMDSDKKAELDSKIAELQSKIQDAKQAEDDAKTAWDEAEDKLKQLNDEKDSLQTELDELNEQMTALEEEITQKYPEIQQYLDAYNTAKDEYNSYKQEAISNAKADIQESQNYVNEVQTAITNFNNKEDTKEYCMSGDLGDEVLELAYSMLGYSEGQVEGECGYNLPDGLWCAAFVKYVLSETYGDELPEWYTNCNYNSCSEVLAAANNNGCAFTDANDAKPGDLIIFNTNRGTARHIGIVVSVENGVIKTIEGNTSSQVGERTYEVGSSKVNSFVRVTE